MRTFPLMLAVLAACPGPAPATTDSPDPGTTTTTTTSTTSSSSSSTSSDSTTTAALPDLPPPCPVGALGCPCTAGGACDPSLTCEAGLCVEGCAVGMEGCACTLGGACDAGLVCEAETCVPAPDPVSPPCVQFPQSNCCGNGILDPLEECDLGYLGGNNDAGSCTESCKKAACGDGAVYAGHEACDGGEACAEDCTITTCGDGVVQPPEPCEPRGLDDPDCTSTCIDARKTVFITSTHYNGGDLGGLVGARAKCQKHAEDAGLEGVFWALLGDSQETAPIWSWPPTGVLYVDVNGKFLADNFGVFCGMQQPLDEFGMPHAGCATPYLDDLYWAWWEYDWSTQATCNGWSDPEAKGGAFGIATCMTGPGMPCNEAAPIICVEQ